MKVHNKTINLNKLTCVRCLRKFYIYFKLFNLTLYFRVLLHKHIIKEISFVDKQFINSELRSRHNLIQQIKIHQTRMKLIIIHQKSLCQNSY